MRKIKNKSNKNSLSLTLLIIGILISCFNLILSLVFLNFRFDGRGFDTLVGAFLLGSLLTIGFVLIAIYLLIALIINIIQSRTISWGLILGIIVLVNAILPWTPFYSKIPIIGNLENYFLISFVILSIYVLFNSLFKLIYTIKLK